MTRSKIEFAKILVSLRGDGSDPQKLANEMTLSKLCYEIEKIEEVREKTVKESSKPKSFWSFLSEE